MLFVCFVYLFSGLNWFVFGCFGWVWWISFLSFLFGAFCADLLGECGAFWDWPLVLVGFKKMTLIYLKGR